MLADKIKTIQRIEEKDLLGAVKEEQRIGAKVIAFREQLVGDFSEIQFDQPHWYIIDFKDRGKYKAEYYFQVNVDKPSNIQPNGRKKDLVFDYIKLTGKPYMVCELSAFRQSSYQGDPDDWYFTLGWFHFLRNGYFNNNFCTNDRWLAIQQHQGLEVLPWKTDLNSRKYALICLQKVNDSTMKALMDNHGKYKHWLWLVVNQIRHKYPKLPIVIRPHLRTKPNNYMPIVEETKGCTVSETWEDRTYFEGGAGLQQDLDGAKFVVSYNSNVLTQATMQGIPSICWDINSVAAPVCLDPSQLHKLNEVTRIDRQQWLNDLSYTQWSRKEIRNGQAWRHLEQYGF